MRSQSPLRALLLVAAALLSLTGCANRVSVSMVPAGHRDPGAAAPVSPGDVVITADDVTNRPYRSLGDISVSLSKWTVFSPDPTRDELNEALREKAARVGADAVILVRYGAVGITPWTYGQLNGVGRAISFVR